MKKYAIYFYACLLFNAHTTRPVRALPSGLQYIKIGALLSFIKKHNMMIVVPALGIAGFGFWWFMLSKKSKPAEKAVPADSVLPQVAVNNKSKNDTKWEENFSKLVKNSSEGALIASFSRLQKNSEITAEEMANLNQLVAKTSHMGFCYLKQNYPVLVNGSASSSSFSVGFGCPKIEAFSPSNLPFEDFPRFFQRTFAFHGGERKFWRVLDDCEEKIENFEHLKRLMQRQ